MKTILVDCIDGLILRDGTLFREMHKVLEEYPNPKLVLTGANEEEWKHFNLDISPYEIFTLEHNPEKTNPEYFNILLDIYNLKPSEVVFFEHNQEAVKTAQSVGINTYYYDPNKRDLKALKSFLGSNV